MFVIMVGLLIFAVQPHTQKTHHTMLEISDVLNTPDDTKKLLGEWANRGLKLYNPRSKKFDMDSLVNSFNYPMVLATNGQRMMPFSVKGLTNELLWRNIEAFWGSLDGMPKRHIIGVAETPKVETPKAYSFKIIFTHPIDFVLGA